MTGDLIAGIEYAFQAAILGFVAAHFFYRIILNHLGGQLRWRVIWLTGLFTSFSLLALARIPARVGLVFGIGDTSGRPETAWWFLLLLLISMVSTAGFWFTFRDSFIESDAAREDSARDAIKKGQS
jgi:hypothetical protein